MAENTDTLTHTIEFDEPIDKIIIIPDEGGRRTANFFFGTEQNIIYTSMNKGDYMAPIL